jgi:hypothetical protein
LKLKHGLFFIAVVLSAVAPAFADKIPAALKYQEGNYVTVQDSPQKEVFERSFAFGTFNRTIFKKDEFSSELNLAVRMSEFRKGSEIADLGSDSRRVSLLGVGFKHDDSGGKNDEKSRRKHKEGHRDDVHALAPIVAVPEPRSLTLLLFGLAVSGMIVYRRNSQ